MAITMTITVLCEITIEDESGTTLENAAKIFCQMAINLEMNWDGCEKKTELQHEDANSVVFNS
jgi:hypothetical protein